MRIISGKYKGRRITAPSNLPVRPTTDMSKEALFNILNNRIYFEEVSVLDLFSGIGSISLEFASRGAENILAVDKHAACVRFLEKTSNALDLPVQTLKSDVFSFLEQTTRRFDLIFADPPYDMEIEKFEKIVTTVLERKLLEDEGLLILEHGKNYDFSHMPQFLESRKYGGSAFSFFAAEE